MERDQVAEVIRTRALINSQFVCLNSKVNMAEKTFDAFKEYAQILLPSRRTTVKIEEMRGDQLKQLREVIKAKKLAMENRNKK